MDSAIEEKLNRISKTVDKIDATLNDDATGLKTRVALLEQIDSTRLWRERITIVAIVGIVVRLIIVATTGVSV